MSDSLQIRSVHLRVSDLGRSVDYYTRQLGFAAVSDGSGTAALATSPGAPALLELTEDTRAPRAPRDAAGLFHAALLLPSRVALGRWLRETHAAGTTFDGFADHGVSEAVYLADPDGNGLEFYADRPPSGWPQHAGELAMTTEPLDLPGLLAAAKTTSDPLLAGARWGHLHLRVTDLDRSERFYTETFGVSLTQRFGPSARFLAADGYHHHFGLNTWGGVRRPIAPDSLGLISATLAAGVITSARPAVDPDGIHLELRSL